MMTAEIPQILYVSKIWPDANWNEASLSADATDNPNLETLPYVPLKHDSFLSCLKPLRWELTPYDGRRKGALTAPFYFSSYHIKRREDGWEYEGVLYCGDDAQEKAKDAAWADHKSRVSKLFDIGMSGATIAVKPLKWARADVPNKEMTLEQAVGGDGVTYEAYGGGGYVTSEGLQSTNAYGRSLEGAKKAAEDAYRESIRSLLDINIGGQKKLEAEVTKLRAENEELTRKMSAKPDATRERLLLEALRSVIEATGLISKEYGAHNLSGPQLLLAADDFVRSVKETEGAPEDADTLSAQDAAAALLKAFTSNDVEVDFKPAWESWQKTVWGKDGSIYDAMQAWLGTLAKPPQDAAAASHGPET